MIRRHYWILYFLFFVSVLYSHNCAAGANDSVYDLIGRRPDSSPPKESFNSWPDADKAKNMKKIYTKCVVVTGMAFGGVSNEPAERLREEEHTALMTCMYQNIPDDHPKREQYKAIALEHYKKAKELGSTFSLPTFQ